VNIDNEREDSSALVALLALSRQSIETEGTRPAREVLDELRAKLIDSRKADMP
jgi:hypothetical protein